MLVPLHRDMQLAQLYNDMEARLQLLGTKLRTKAAGRTARAR